MYGIFSDIYEIVGGRAKKVVRHVFYGGTKEEAAANERAHRTTDMFYRLAVTQGRMGNLQLEVRSWIKIIRPGE